MHDTAETAQAYNVPPNTEVITTTSPEGSQVDEIKPNQYTETITPHQGYEPTPDDAANINMMRMQAMQDEKDKMAMAQANATLQEIKTDEHQTEDIARVTQYEAPTTTHDVTPSVLAPQDVEPKMTKVKGLEIKGFFDNLAEQLKLEKVVGVAKKIAAIPKKMGAIALRWWNNVSSSTSTQTPTTA